VRDTASILADIDEAAEKYGDQVEKVFFLLASAISADTDTLCAAARRCRDRFPRLRAISSYAHPLDILGKSDEALARLVDAGMTRLYVGVESGSDAVLRSMQKGGTPAQVERACLRVLRAGFTLSCQVILGLGGRRFTTEHARDTARILSRISPHYVGFLGLMITPRTALAAEVEAGSFELLESDQYLEELETILDGIRPERPIVVRTNHPSNYIDLRGTLPRDREAMLDTIRCVRAGTVPVNEEFLRNL